MPQTFDYMGALREGYTPKEIKRFVKGLDQQNDLEQRGTKFVQKQARQREAVNALVESSRSRASAGLTPAETLYPAGVTRDPIGQDIQNTAAAPNVPRPTGIVRAENVAPDLVSAFEQAPESSLGDATSGYLAEAPNVKLRGARGIVQGIKDAPKAGWLGLNQAASAGMQAIGDVVQEDIGILTKAAKATSDLLTLNMSPTEIPADTGSNVIQRVGRDAYAAHTQGMQELSDKYAPDSWGGAVMNAGAQTGQQLGILGTAAAIGIRSPAAMTRFSLGALGAQSGLTEYGDARAKGFDVPRSMLKAGVGGGMEVATEVLPMGKLVNFMSAPAKKGVVAFLKDAAEYGLQDIGGELLNTMITDVVNNKMQARPNMTPQEQADEVSKYFSSGEWKQAAADTFKQAVLQSGIMMGAAKGVQHLDGKIRGEQDPLTDGVAFQPQNLPPVNPERQGRVDKLAGIMANESERTAQMRLNIANQRRSQQPAPALPAQQVVPDAAQPAAPTVAPIQQQADSTPIVPTAEAPVEPVVAPEPAVAAPAQDEEDIAPELADLLRRKTNLEKAIFAADGAEKKTATKRMKDNYAALTATITALQQQNPEQEVNANGQQAEPETATEPGAVATDAAGGTGGAAPADETGMGSAEAMPDGAVSGVDEQPGNGMPVLRPQPDVAEAPQATPDIMALVDGKSDDQIQKTIDMVRGLNPERAGQIEAYWKSKATPASEPQAEQESTPAAQDGQESVPPAGDATQKQPWEMTREEWKTGDHSTQRSGKNIYYVRPDKTRTLWAGTTSKQKAIESQHRFEIQRAMQDGRTISAEVLKDYPDLNQKVDDANGAKETGSTATPSAVSGRSLFTPGQLDEFDKRGIDVSKVPAQYKNAALQQLGFQQEQESKLASPDYDANVQAEYDRIEAARKETVSSPRPEPAKQSVDKRLDPTSMEVRLDSKLRSKAIKQSKESGTKHLDQVEHSVEAMRGKRIRSIFDGSTGTITSANSDNSINMVWDDEKSAGHNSASLEEYPSGRNGKTVQQWTSRLTRHDISDFEILPETRRVSRGVVTQPPVPKPILKPLVTPSEDQGKAAATSGPSVTNPNVVSPEKVKQVAQEIKTLRDRAQTISESIQGKVLPNGVVVGRIGGAKGDRMAKRADEMRQQANSLEDNWYAALHPESFTPEEMEEAKAKGMPVVAAPDIAGQKAAQPDNSPETILYDLAKSAHAHVSSSPNMAAKVYRDGMVSAADELRKSLEGIAVTPRQQDVLNWRIDSFKREYVEKSRPILRAISNQVSSLVAGGSKFAGTHGKRNSRAQTAEQNANDAFQKWFKGAQDEVRQAVLDARTPEQVEADNQAKKDAEESKVQRRATAEREIVRRFMALKVGDSIDVGGNEPATITKKNRKSVETGSGAKWTFGELYSIDNKRVDELMAELERAGKSEGQTGSTAQPPPLSPVAAHDDFIKRLDEGSATPDDLKASFASLQENRDAIKAELGKLKKDDLLGRLGRMEAYRYKNDKKEIVVNAVFRRMLNSHNLSGTIQYNPMEKGAMDAALKAKVDATTERDIADHAEQVKAAREDAKKRMEGLVKSAKNPETWEEFQSFIRMHKDKGGIDALTPEQRKRYDELHAEHNKEAAAKQVERKATVREAGEQVDSEIVETTHTKTGDPLFVVKAADRVDKDVYKEWNATAKKLGGWYSSYRAGGAVPGFQFKTRESAESFRQYLKGDAGAASETIKERIEERQESKKQSAADKLAALADSMEEKANGVLNADRLTNTAKRAQQAESTDASARKTIALATTIRNIARAIQAGEAKHLEGISAGTHIETLDAVLSAAKYTNLRENGPSGWSVSDERYRMPNESDMDYVDYPYPNPHQDHIKEIGLVLREKSGAVKDGEWLMKRYAVTSGNNSSVITFTSPSDIERLESVLAKAKKVPRLKSAVENVTERMAKYKRLQKMGIPDEPTLRAALREYLQFKDEGPKADKAKQLERQLAGNKNVGIDFFPTPPAVAADLVERAGIEPGMKVLEPSGGTGNIAEAIREAGAEVDVAEISGQMRELLEAKGFNLVAHDFMDLDEGSYDAVVMNPPFSADIEHVRHAFDLLKPGGRLVAIVGEGSFGNQKKHTEFQEWLDEHGATVEKLPQGTFTDRTQLKTTGANARVVEMVKPGEVKEGYRPTFSRLTPAGKRGSAQAYTVHLSPSQALSLKEIRQEVSDGEAGGRAGIYNDSAPGTTQVSWGSSFPEYFQNRGLTKKQVLPILDRIIRGESVTEAQWLIAEDMLKAKRYDTLNRILNERHARRIESLSELTDDQITEANDFADEFFSQFDGTADDTAASTGGLREDDSAAAGRDGEASGREEGISAPATVAIDESGWGQQVAPELQGNKKQVRFGDKKQTGRNVGLSEFMDEFTPDPQGGLSFSPGAQQGNQRATLSHKEIDKVIDLISRALPADKVTLKIVDDIILPSDAKAAYAAHGVDKGAVAGMHQSVTSIRAGEVRSIITLAMDGATDRTGYHEVMHAAEALGVITAADLKTLERIYPSKDGVDSSERRADAFAEYVANKEKSPGITSRIFGRIRAFLNRLGLALRGKGWRTADDVFSDLLGGKLRRDTSGVPRPDAGTQFMTAWHGSPHDHDKFSMDKIGTGEGAQAYGYGLYFAGNKEVAEYYKRVLAERDIRIDGKRSFEWPVSDVTKSFVLEYGGDVPAAIVRAKELLRTSGATMRSQLSAALSDLETLERDGSVQVNKGKLYQVELAPSDDEYLLWDKPLSEQSEKVKEALKDAAAKTTASGMNPSGYIAKALRNGGWEQFKGNTLYDVISELAGFNKEMTGGWTTRIKNDQAASEYLHSLGIRGIKYLDGSSRGAGEGNFNYVIFDDNDVTIEAKFSLRDSSTPTLDSMGLQQIYERLASTKLVKDAMADLKRLGGHVYAQGSTAWKPWFQGMKDSLGKLFRRFRPTMEKLYATTKSDARYSKGGKGADNNGFTGDKRVRDYGRQGNDSERGNSGGLSQYADSEPKSHAERVRRLAETSPAGLSGKPVALPANRPGGEADDGQRVSGSRYSLRTDRTGDPRVDAVLDKIGSPDKTLADRIKDSLGNLAHKETRMREIEQGFFDRYASLRYLDKMAGITGPDDSAYISARMSTSFSDVMYAMVHHGHPIWKDGGSAVQGKGLMEIFKPVADELDVFLGWMVGARAQKLMNEGRERYFDQDEINILKGLKTPENSARWEKVRRDYMQYKKQVLDFAEQAGVINPEARKIWDHEEYVPFYRVVEDKPKGPFKVKGLASQNSGVRTLKGADERLGDIFENIIRNFSHLTDASIKNRATELAVQKAEQIGAATPAPLEWKAVKIGNQQVVDAVHEFFGETQEDVDAFVNPEEMEAFTTFFHPAKPMGKDVIHVLRDGKPQYYQVHDDLLLRSMTSINEQIWGGPAMTIMRFVKRLLTIGVTSDPTFMLRNFIRDTLHTWTISRGDFVPVISSLTGAVKAFRKDDDMVQLMAAGGAFHGGFAYGNDPAAVKLMVRKLINKKGIDKSTILDTVKKVWEAYQEIGSAMENAARVQTYANVKAKTGSHLQAAFDAKDIMDFSVRGDWAAINFLVQTVPFLGARIQGLQRLGKGAMENPVAFTLKGSAIALASTLLWLHNSMRPEYQELEEWDKDTYFHFFVGKKHFRLPKPFEVGSIFGTIPERLMELTLEKQHDGGLFFERMMAILTQTFAVGLPQILSEPGQQWANKDFFTGREIVGRDLQRLLPGEQSTPYTSVTAKGLGRAVNFSPKRIEHAVKGYFGTLGMYCLGASDMLVRKLWDYPARPTTKPEDWPVLSAFYRGEGPARNTKYTTEFYELLREADQLTDTVQRLRETGEVPRAEKLIEKNLPKLAAGGILGQAQSELSRINKQMKIVHLDRSMSPDEKRSQLVELQRIKNEITRGVVGQAKAAMD